MSTPLSASLRKGLAPSGSGSRWRCGRALTGSAEHLEIFAQFFGDLSQTNLAELHMRWPVASAPSGPNPKKWF